MAERLVNTRDPVHRPSSSQDVRGVRALPSPQQSAAAAWRRSPGPRPAAASRPCPPPDVSGTRSAPCYRSRDQRAVGQADTSSRSGSAPHPPPAGPTGLLRTAAGSPRPGAMAPRQVDPSLGKGEQSGHRQRSGRACRAGSAVDCHAETPNAQRERCRPIPAALVQDAGTWSASTSRESLINARPSARSLFASSVKSDEEPRVGADSQGMGPAAAIFSKMRCQTRR